MTTRTSQHQVSWDFVRVFAIISVVVQHATHEAVVLLPDLSPMPFIWGFQVGANTMLLISAYFVCVTVRKRKPFGWWWKRVARLIPPYLVAVLLTFAVLALVQMPGLFHPTLRDLWGNLMLRESFDPTLGYMDPSYWTLPVQLTAFTVAALLARRFRWSRAWALPAMSWALIVVPLLLKLYRLDSDTFRGIYDGIGMHRWHIFGMGIAIWLWTQRRMSLEHMALLLTCGLFAQYWQDLGVDYIYESTLALGVVVVMVCLTATGAEWLGPLTRVLARPLAWLAGISYGIYLLNQQLGYLIALELHQVGVDGWLRFWAVIGAAILMGWLLTKLVERPIHGYLVQTLPTQLARLGHAIRVGTVSATVTLRIARLQCARWLNPRRGEARVENPQPQRAIPHQRTERAADFVRK